MRPAARPWSMAKDRQNAGVEADSAMTGLALLAFLASGQTHRDGPHTDQVRRGLEYLLSVQAADGNLAGRADLSPACTRTPWPPSP